MHSQVMGAVGWRVRAQVGLALGRRKGALFLSGEEGRGRLKIYVEEEREAMRQTQRPRAGGH